MMQGRISCIWNLNLRHFGFCGLNQSCIHLNFNLGMKFGHLDFQWMNHSLFTELRRDVLNCGGMCWIEVGRVGFPWALLCIGHSFWWQAVKGCWGHHCLLRALDWPRGGYFWGDVGRYRVSRAFWSAASGDILGPQMITTGGVTMIIQLKITTHQWLQISLTH